MQGETLGLRKMSLVKGSWGDFPVGGIEAGSGLSSKGGAFWDARNMLNLGGDYVGIHVYKI